MKLGIFNKKGISPLVATVIIIAITVAAGITLYAMVFPLISKPIAQTTCTEITFELDGISSCVEFDFSGTPGARPNYNTVRVSIDRTKSGPDEPPVVGWNLVLDAGFGERRSFDLPASFVVSAGEQSTHPYPVSDLVAGTELLGNVTRISVYPVINVRGAQLTCEDVTQTIERLKKCVVQ